VEEGARKKRKRTGRDPDEGPAESIRLAEDTRREKNWKRFGPYLAERQWGTVREDYSPSGDSWEYFPHDHARSRAYRWGEDGLLGITDREGRLCFALALWNGRDPILKERLFGLTGPEGNHGEDVKELYFYLDSTPTHSYLKAMYRYPQAGYPYDTVLPLQRPALALGGPVPSEARRPAEAGEKPRPETPLQPGRDLGARQVGIPLLRRLGPGVPHGPVRENRPAFRQGAADPLPA